MSVRISGSGGEEDMSTHCDEDLMSCGESKSLDTPVVGSAF